MAMHGLGASGEGWRLGFASVSVASLLAERQTTPETVLEHIEPGADVIVGAGNGEPRTVVDVIEAAADRLQGVRMHQMLPLRPRPCFSTGGPGLRHVSWFLTPADRDAFHAGTCDLVPNNFSEVPLLMRTATKASLLVVAVAPPDRHGYFSLGLQADYSAALIGRVPFFVEVNHQMPRTFGENQVHVSQLLGWCEADYPLVDVPNRRGDALDERIADLVAERIPHGATLQAGIGAVPSLVLERLREHRDLGIHSEILAEGFIDLVECGAVTGTRKKTNRNTIVVTGAHGAKRLQTFVEENAGVEFWPVDMTNDSRLIGQEDDMVAINATLEVDFLGQCASESLGSHYWSSTGGQLDFGHGAMYAERGQAFIVLLSTAGADGEISRIVPQLHPGAAVTTLKNVVDKVVTEHGVAELRGTPIGERTRRLIAIADPRHRDELTRRAVELGYLRP
jgi:acyl-CoA hydrolase